MKNSRLVGFLLAILLGICAGLAYGWLIKPAGVKTTSLDSMRGDYKADFVVMVAENYVVDQDLPLALEMLEKVAPGEPGRVVQEALLTGQDLSFSQFEMDALTALNSTVNPQVEESQ